MERLTIQRRLDQARDAFHLGAERVRRQRNRIVQLELGGREGETTLAWELLGTFLDSQALHVGTLDRMVRELVDFDLRRLSQGD